MSVSTRLAQEDAILREIRSSLSVLGTMQGGSEGRRGTVYASAPITSGWRLYHEAKLNGFASADEYRRAKPAEFKRDVFQPNLRDGARFGDFLRETYPKVIVPGAFFASGWAQDHYMSLWRQVIVRHARTVALTGGWEYSLGCSEEFVIAIQNSKRLLDDHRAPFDYRAALELLRIAVDTVDGMGFDAKPHYELWRLAALTLEATRPAKKTA